LVRGRPGPSPGVLRRRLTAGDLAPAVTVPPVALEAWPRYHGEGVRNSFVRSSGGCARPVDFRFARLWAIRFG
jgi:hypothetical protein